MTPAFDALDRIRASVTSVAIEPAFSREIDLRSKRTPRTLSSDAECLQELASLIAFSQGARSDLVGKMIDAGGLQTAFEGFNVSRVAALEVDSVIENHWERIRCIRYKKKVKGIIGVAKVFERLRREGFNLREHLNNYPARIRQLSDISDFWQSFDSLQKRFRAVETPYFNKLTSLLHLLLHFGFDCLKPDLVVQNTAVEIGLLAPKPRDKDLRQLVKTVQEYSLSREIRPGVVDLYLLVYGGQKWAMQFAKATAPRIRAMAKQGGAVT